jgi:hypothetical protein
MHTNTYFTYRYTFYKQFTLYMLKHTLNANTCMHAIHTVHAKHDIQIHAHTHVQIRTHTHTHTHTNTDTHIHTHAYIHTHTHI